VLPTRSWEYGGEFRTYPTETFQHERISVPSDDSRKTGRVYLKTGKKKRVFGRVWIPEDAIRVKALSVSSFKTRLTYGVSRSLHRLAPPGCRFRLL